MIKINYKTILILSFLAIPCLLVFGNIDTKGFNVLSIDEMKHCIGGDGYNECKETAPTNSEHNCQHCSIKIQTLES